MRTQTALRIGFAFIIAGALFGILGALLRIARSLGVIQ